MKLIHFHWQNLNEDKHGNIGFWLFNYRAWLDIGCFGFNWEWKFWSKHFGFQFEWGEYNGDDFQISICPYIFSFYLSFEGFLPRKWKNYGWPRSTGVRIFSSAIWLDLWNDTSWHGRDKPWWQHKVIHIDNLILGKSKYSEETIKEEDDYIAMPEGSYPCHVRIFRSTWKRPRWFAHSMIRTQIDIPKGIYEIGRAHV